MFSFYLSVRKDRVVRLFGEITVLANPIPQSAVTRESRSDTLGNKPTILYHSERTQVFLPGSKDRGHAPRSKRDENIKNPHFLSQTPALSSRKLF